MFEDDRHLQNIITNIRDAVNKAFSAAGKYADTFEPFRVFYKENESLDLVALRQNDTGIFGRTGQPNGVETRSRRTAAQWWHICCRCAVGVMDD